jgi:ribosome-binding protein aMBF1 (putative translation factor)
MREREVICIFTEFELIIICNFAEVKQNLHIYSKILSKVSKMINYGENLKEQRLSRGITLKEIEKETGINNGNLSRWERGVVLPNIDFCVQLADYYGITLDELIGRDYLTTHNKK